MDNNSNISSKSQLSQDALNTSQNNVKKKPDNNNFQRQNTVNTQMESQATKSQLSQESPRSSVFLSRKQSISKPIVQLKQSNSQRTSISRNSISKSNSIINVLNKEMGNLEQSNSPKKNQDNDNQQDESKENRRKSKVLKFLKQGSIKPTDATPKKANSIFRPKTNSVLLSNLMSKANIQIKGEDGNEITSNIQVTNFDRLEIQFLAKQLGIDYDNEIDNYGWILYSFIQNELPQNWRREIDTQGNVIYYNLNTYKSQFQHPYLSNFLFIFNQIAEKSDHRRQIYVKQKLEQKQQIEEKLLKLQKKESKVNQKQIQNLVQQLVNIQQDIANKQKFTKILNFNKNFQNLNLKTDTTKKKAEISQEDKKYYKYTPHQLAPDNLHRGFLNVKNDKEFLKEEQRNSLQQLLNVVITEQQNLELNKNKNIDPQNFSLVPEQPIGTYMSDNYSVLKETLNQKTCQHAIEQGVLTQQQPDQNEKKDEKQEKLQYLDFTKENIDFSLNKFTDSFIINAPGTTSNILQHFDAVMSQTTQYYISKYSVQPYKVLEQLEKENINYKQADPDEVANAIIYLNISSQECDLFWLGRAFVTLELPSMWESVHINNEQGQIYVDTVTNLRLNIHPAYKLYKETPHYMDFSDKIGRIFKIDMKDILQQKETELLQNPEQSIAKTALNYLLNRIQTKVLKDDQKSDTDEEYNEEDQIKNILRSQKRRGGQVIDQNQNSKQKHLLSFLNDSFQEKISYKRDSSRKNTKRLRGKKNELNLSQQKFLEPQNNQYDDEGRVLSDSSDSQNSSSIEYQKKQLEEEETELEIKRLQQVMADKKKNVEPKKRFSSMISGIQKKKSQLSQNSSQIEIKEVDEIHEKEDSSIISNNKSKLQENRQIISVELSSSKDESVISQALKKIEDQKNQISNVIDEEKKINEVQNERLVTLEKMIEETKQKKLALQNSSQNKLNISTNSQKNIQNSNNISQIKSDVSSLDQTVDLQYVKGYHIFKEDEISKIQLTRKRNHQNIKHKIKHQRFNSNLKDNHLIYLCKIFNIEIPQDVHLLTLLTEYLIHKENVPIEHRWNFRTDDYGEPYWINLELLQTTKEYPHFEELNKLLSLYRKCVEKEKTKMKIKEDVLDTFNKIFDEEIPPLQIFTKMRREAKSFIKQYVFDYKEGKNIYDEDEMLKKDDLTKKQEVFTKIGNLYELTNIFQYLRSENQVLSENIIKDQMLFYFPFQLVKKQSKKQKNIQQLAKEFQEQDEKKPPTTIDILSSAKFLDGEFFEENYDFDQQSTLSESIETSSISNSSDYFDEEEEKESKLKRDRKNNDSDSQENVNQNSHKHQNSDSLNSSLENSRQNKNKLVDNYRKFLLGQSDNEQDSILDGEDGQSSSLQESEEKSVDSDELLNELQNQQQSSSEHEEQQDWEKKLFFDPVRHFQLIVRQVIEKNKNKIAIFSDQEFRDSSSSFDQSYFQGTKTKSKFQDNTPNQKKKKNTKKKKKKVTTTTTTQRVNLHKQTNNDAKGNTLTPNNKQQQNQPINKNKFIQKVQNKQLKLSTEKEQSQSKSQTLSKQNSFISGGNLSSAKKTPGMHEQFKKSQYSQNNNNKNFSSESKQAEIQNQQLQQQQQPVKKNLQKNNNKQQLKNSVNQIKISQRFASKSKENSQESYTKKLQRQQEKIKQQINIRKSQNNSSVSSNDKSTTNIRNTKKKISKKLDQFSVAKTVNNFVRKSRHTRQQQQVTNTIIKQAEEKEKDIDEEKLVEQSKQDQQKIKEFKAKVQEDKKQQKIQQQINKNNSKSSDSEEDIRQNLPMYPKNRLTKEGNVKTSEQEKQKNIQELNKEIQERKKKALEQKEQEYQERKRKTQELREQRELEKLRKKQQKGIVQQLITGHNEDVLREIEEKNNKKVLDQLQNNPEANLILSKQTHSNKAKQVQQTLDDKKQQIIESKNKEIQKNNDKQVLLQKIQEREQYLQKAKQQQKLKKQQKQGSQKNISDDEEEKSIQSSSNILSEDEEKFLQKQQEKNYRRQGVKVEEKQKLVQEIVQKQKDIEKEQKLAIDEAQKSNQIINNLKDKNIDLVKDKEEQQNIIKNKMQIKKIVRLQTIRESISSQGIQDSEKSNIDNMSQSRYDKDDEIDVENDQEWISKIGKTKARDNLLQMYYIDEKKQQQPEQLKLVAQRNVHLANAYEQNDEYQQFKQALIGQVSLELETEQLSEQSIKSIQEQQLSSQKSIYNNDSSSEENMIQLEEIIDEEMREQEREAFLQTLYEEMVLKREKQLKQNNFNYKQTPIKLTNQQKLQQKQKEMQKYQQKLKNFYFEQKQVKDWMEQEKKEHKKLNNIDRSIDQSKIIYNTDSSAEKGSSSVIYSKKNNNKNKNHQQIIKQYINSKRKQGDNIDKLNPFIKQHILDKNDNGDQQQSDDTENDYYENLETNNQLSARYLNNRQIPYNNKVSAIQKIQQKDLTLQRRDGKYLFSEKNLQKQKIPSSFTNVPRSLSPRTQKIRQQKIQQQKEEQQKKIEEMCRLDEEYQKSYEQHKKIKEANTILPDPSQVIKYNEQYLADQSYVQDIDLNLQQYQQKKRQTIEQHLIHDPDLKKQQKENNYQILEEISKMVQNIQKTENEISSKENSPTKNMQSQQDIQPQDNDFSVKKISFSTQILENNINNKNKEEMTNEEIEIQKKQSVTQKLNKIFLGNDKLQAKSASPPSRRQSLAIKEQLKLQTQDFRKQLKTNQQLSPKSKLQNIQKVTIANEMNKFFGKSHKSIPAFQSDNKVQKLISQQNKIKETQSLVNIVKKNNIENMTFVNPEESILDLDSKKQIQRLSHVYDYKPLSHKTIKFPRIGQTSLLESDESKQMLKNLQQSVIPLQQRKLFNVQKEPLKLKTINLNSKFKEEQHLNKVNRYEDNFSRYKLNMVFREILKSQKGFLQINTGKQSQQNKPKITKNSQQQIQVINGTYSKYEKLFDPKLGTDQPVQFLKIQGLQQLEKLKQKYIKQQLDMIIYYYLAKKLHDYRINKAKINNQKIPRNPVWENSERLQKIFCKNHMKLFIIMREVLCDIPSVKLNPYIFLMLPAQNLEQQQISHYQIETENFRKIPIDIQFNIEKVLDEFFDHHIKIINYNNVLQKNFETKLEKYLNVEDIKQVETLKDLPTIYEDHPLYNQFSILNTDYVQQQFFQPRKKEIDEKEKLKQLLIENRNILKSKNGQNTDKEDQQIEDLDIEFQYRQNQRMKNIKDHYRTPSCIYRYQEMIQHIENYEKNKSENVITKALKIELGSIHSQQRENLKNWEIYLDYGLHPDSVVKMCLKLNINILLEGDLIWIAYIYCMFLIRYSPNNQQKILDITIQSNSLYDDYFLRTLEFLRIKRQFVFRKLSKRDSQEYVKVFAFLKFYDSDSKSLKQINLQKNYKNIKKNNQLIYTQPSNFQQHLIQKYQFIENETQIEMLEGMLSIISEDGDYNKLIQDYIAQQNHQDNKNIINEYNQYQSQSQISLINDSKINQSSSNNDISIVINQSASNITNDNQNQTTNSSNVNSSSDLKLPLINNKLNQKQQLIN